MREINEDEARSNSDRNSDRKIAHCANSAYIASRKLQKKQLTMNNRAELPDSSNAIVIILVTVSFLIGYWGITETLLWLLCGPKTINGKKYTLLPKANLVNANLSGADLSGSDLYDANLSGANLSGADLSGVCLLSANLSDANLSFANLSGTYLCNANLANTNVYGVDFTKLRYPLSEWQLRQISASGKTSLNFHISKMILILLALNGDNQSSVNKLFVIKDIVSRICCHPLLVEGFAEYLNHMKQSHDTTLKIVNRHSFWKPSRDLDSSNASAIQKIESILNNKDLSKTTKSKRIYKIASENLNPLLKSKYTSFFDGICRDNFDYFLKNNPEINEDENENLIEQRLLRNNT
jgi:uncharacterized protein YjbI with pentapeptide repeats